MPLGGSSLLALPYEIRLPIWKSAMGGRSFKIDVDSGPPPEFRTIEVYPRYRATQKLIGRSPSGSKWSWRMNGSRKWEKIGLPFVCRQVYLETIHLLYEDNYFEFGIVPSGCSWETLKLFSSLIPRDCRESMRYLKLHMRGDYQSRQHFRTEYDPTSRSWAVVPGFSRVQHLYLGFDFVQSTAGLFHDELAPLISLKSRMPALEILETTFYFSIYSAEGLCRRQIEDAMEGIDGWSVEAWETSQEIFEETPLPYWGLNFWRSSNRFLGHISDGRQKSDPRIGQRFADDPRKGVVVRLDLPFFTYQEENWA